MRAILLFVAVIAVASAISPSSLPEPKTWESASIRLRDGRSAVVSRKSPLTEWPDSEAWRQVTFDLKDGDNISMIYGSKGVLAISMNYGGQEFAVSPKDVPKISGADLATLRVSHWLSLRPEPHLICLSAVVEERTMPGDARYRETKTVTFWFSEDGSYRAASFESAAALADASAKKEPNQSSQPSPGRG